MHYGGGLSLSFLQTSYTVYVNVINVTLYNNTGISFGNFIMTILEVSSNTPWFVQRISGPVIT